MFQLINKYFTRKRIGVDISNNNVKAIESTGGIYVDKPIGEIIETKNAINPIDHWQDAKNIAKILNYCVSKLGILFFQPEIILIIPTELSNYNKDKIKNIVVHNVRQIYFLQSVIAAAIGASTNEIKIMSEDTLTRKFYIFSDKTHTYVSLIWAGSLVEFRKIDKGYYDIEMDELIKEITDIKLNLPYDVPQMYLNIPNIDMYKDSWNEPIEKNIYISVPMETQDRMGRSNENYNLVYTNYDENLIMTGISSVIGKLSNKG